MGLRSANFAIRRKSLFKNIFDYDSKKKMYLRSDWFIQELRYLKFQVHIKMVKYILNGEVFIIFTE